MDPKLYGKIPEAMASGLQALSHDRPCKVCQAVPVLDIVIRSNGEAVLARDCHGRRFSLAIGAGEWRRDDLRTSLVRLFKAVQAHLDRLEKAADKWGRAPKPHFAARAEP